MLKTAFSFITGNASAIFAGAKIFAFIGLAYLAIDTVRDFMADQKAKTEALITANADKVGAQAMAQELKNANILMAQSLEIQKESLAIATKNIALLNEQYAEFRAIKNKEAAVFAEHDVEALTRAKPKMLERLANRATKARFEDLAEALK